MTDDPRLFAETAAARIAHLTGMPRHDVLLVVGSGWLPALDALGEPTAEFPTHDVPGFSPSGVAGHGGMFRSVRVGDRQVLVLTGRTHLYEGRGVDAVAHGVRTAAAAGVSIAILTNGAGGLKPSWRPGQPVLIADHVNLSGATPLRGATFIDLTDLYSARLRTLCKEIDPTLDEGVYVQLHGPQYETPAEIRMVRAIGGDLVGMSTAVEAIAAREAGVEVLGISLVTNLAAGMTGEPLSHEEVLAAGQEAASRMGDLLGKVVRRL